MAKKIKIRHEEKKVQGKEFNSVEFFNLHKNKVIRFVYAVVVVILLCFAFFTIRANKKIGAVSMISQAKDLFFEKKYEASLDVYEQFVKQFPKHRLAPAAYLGIAYCYEQLNKNNEAKDGFLKIQKEFPDSAWVEDAVKGVERCNVTKV